MNPYVIDDFFEFLDVFTGDTLDGYFVLTGPVDCAAVEFWSHFTGLNSDEDIAFSVGPAFGAFIHWLIHDSDFLLFFDRFLQLPSTHIDYGLPLVVGESVLMVFEFFFVLVNRMLKIREGLQDVKLAVVKPLDGPPLSVVVQFLKNVHTLLHSR